MEVKHKTLTGCDEQLEVTLTTEELLPHFNDAYKKAVKSSKIDGFRPGKTPVEIIKKLYGPSIQYDSLGEIADKVFKNVIEEKNISPIGTPQIIDMKFKPGDPFSFTIKFEIRPVVELKNYKQLKIEKSIHSVTEKEVLEEVNRLKRIHATYSTANKVEGAEFVVTANIKEFDEEGKEITERYREGIKIYLNEPSTEEEIKTALLNAEVSGTYNAKFLHKHEGHEHKIDLEIFVTGIENITLPEFNDELVKKITKEKFLTVEDFKINIKKEIENYFNEQSDKKFFDDLTQEVVKQHEFAVPETLVNSLSDSFVKELKDQYGKNMPADFDEVKYRETVRPSALWQGKWFLIREEILKKENLTLTDEDIEKQALTESEKLGIDKNTLLNFYKTSDKFREKLLNDKLFDFLKKETIIVEKIVS